MATAAHTSEGADALRRTALDAARRFKSSWAELGRLLVQVRDRGLWEAWGFASFDAYCTKEIRIRQSTAQKLTRSFAFLSKHEPEAANDAELPRKAPPFEVVTVLAEADERGQLSPSEYRSIRDSIWDEERPVAQLRREVIERFPPPPPEPLSHPQQLKKVASTARRLADEAKGCRQIPRELAQQAAELAEAIEEFAADKVA